MNYPKQLKKMNSEELDKEWKKVMKETADLIEADDDEDTKKLLNELKMRPMFDADGEKIKYGGTRRRHKKRKRKTKSRRQKRKHVKHVENQENAVDVLADVKIIC